MNTKPGYRIYIDESGNHDMVNLETERFLGLTGVILNLEYERDVVAPRLIALKTKYFGNGDIVFHRKDIVNKRGCFTPLKDSTLCKAFDHDLIEMLAGFDYKIVSVLIDKREHFDLYREFASHPYHYCMEIMVERYVSFLRSTGAHGDIMAESRERVLDRELKGAYTDLFDNGNEYVHASVLQSFLISRELKLKKKAANSAGLQIADLLVNTSNRAIRANFKMTVAIATEFDRALYHEAIRPKYYSNNDKIVGWGVKKLP